MPAHTLRRLLTKLVCPQDLGGSPMSENMSTVEIGMLLAQAEATSSGQGAMHWYAWLDLRAITPFLFSGERSAGLGMEAHVGPLSSLLCDFLAFMPALWGWESWRVRHVTWRCRARCSSFECSSWRGVLGWWVMSVHPTAWELHLFRWAPLQSFCGSPCEGSVGSAKEKTHSGCLVGAVRKCRNTVSYIISSSRVLYVGGLQECCTNLAQRKCVVRAL